MHWLVALFSKMLFSAVVVLIVFGRMTMRGIMKMAAVFYIVSFLMGGITIALMYMLKVPGVAGNGSFVLNGATFLQIAAGVAVTWYMGNWLADLFREKGLRRRVMYDVTVRIDSSEWVFKALVDTGNSLRDPITGWPVAVLSKSASELIYSKCDSGQFSGFTAIPYRTVNQSSVMFGIRPDYVRLGDRTVTDIILAFSERVFSPWKGTEKYDLLLHQQFLEGEEHDYGEKFDSAGC
jgi:stage II sporulation protein GA (sporulation sigma-E factor processing peptidase)